MIIMLSKLFILLFSLTHLQIQGEFNLLESYLESKKKASYEQYSKDCLNKNNWESCSDADFILLTKLLNEEIVTKKSAIYPEREARKGRNAVIEIFYKVDELGNVEYLNTIKSECGFGDIDIKENWQSENCGWFEKAAIKAISNWNYDPIFINDKAVIRKIPHRLTFVVEKTTNRDVDAQFTELSSKEIRALNRVINKNDLDALIEFAGSKALENPLYFYYLAVAYDDRKDFKNAEINYLNFISKTGNKYFIFGNKAKMRLITLLYQADEYKKIVEIYDADFKRFVQERDPGDQYLIAYLLVASAKNMIQQDIQALDMFLNIQSNLAEKASNESTKKILIENAAYNIDAILKQES